MKQQLLEVLCVKKGTTVVDIVTTVYCSSKNKNIILVLACLLYSYHINYIFTAAPVSAAQRRANKVHTPVATRGCTVPLCTVLLARW